MPFKNVEDRKAYQREKQRQYRAAHPEKSKAAQAKYAAAHPERVKALREKRKPAEAEYKKKYYQDHVEEKKAYGAAYYKANTEKVTIRNKKWAAENRERKLENDRLWRENNKDHLASIRRAWADNNRAYISQKAKETQQQRRMACMLAYSDNDPKCACCGERHLEFLTLDHINNDGAAHRREVGNSNMYRWVIRNKFPEGFQVLCCNCNFAKGIFGYCPHNKPAST